LCAVTRDMRAGIPLRPAHADDAERLRKIAATAKGHWGYDAGLVSQWARGLDFPAKLHKEMLTVAELDGAIVAWASLIPPRDGVAVLEDLWVEPEYMGHGIGSALFELARDRAERLGAHAMEWEAEPNAIGFYERMGGRHVRDQVSEWGRTLQVIAVSLGSPTINHLRG
jgi:GNAT superfamily N-acetyltransferase